MRWSTKDEATRRASDRSFCRLEIEARIDFIVLVTLKASSACRQGLFGTVVISMGGRESLGKKHSL